MASLVGAESESADHEERSDVEDMMKILVATDNHIGYMEKDQVRFNDSLEAFEEVLKVAKAENVSESSANYIKAGIQKLPTLIVYWLESIPPIPGLMIPSQIDPLLGCKIDGLTLALGTVGPSIIHDGLGLGLMPIIASPG